MRGRHWHGSVTVYFRDAPVVNPKMSPTPGHHCGQGSHDAPMKTYTRSSPGTISKNEITGSQTIPPPHSKHRHFFVFMRLYPQYYFFVVVVFAPFLSLLA